MPITRSLTGKLVFWTLLAIAVTQIPLAVYYQRESRSIVDDSVHARGRAQVELTLARIQAEVRSVEDAARTLATLLQHQQSDLERSTLGLRRAALERSLESFVREHPRVFGSTAAFEPGGFHPELSDYAPYYYKASWLIPRIDYADLADETYAYREQSWYRAPVETREALWSEPYFDEGGGEILMATYSVPLFVEHISMQRLIGVVTADLSLDVLARIVDEARIGDSGYGFVLSASGRFLAAPDRDWVEQGLGVDDVATDPVLQGLADIAERMRAGEQGQAELVNLRTGNPGLLAFAPLGSTGWTVALGVDREELLGSIDRLARLQWAVVAAELLLLVVVLVLVSRSIIAPLRSLAAATRELANGDLDFSVPGNPGRDEVGTLTRDFVTMRDALRRHIEELTQATAAKQKLESELAIAHDIQMAMLPGESEARALSDRVGIAAHLAPAKAVGGDLYDYLPLGDGRLLLLIGDVSDKGVPAALLMARTLALIKGEVARDADLAGVLERVNAELAADNPACMFVTLLCGLLEVETGRVELVNAGHNPPLLRRADGELEWLELAGGPALGLIDGAGFDSQTLDLRAGDALVMYTDGVTEAFNAAGQAYGEDRLEASLSGRATGGAAQITAAILEPLAEFVGAAPASDDLTLLVVRMGEDRAAASTATPGESIALPPRMDQLDAALGFVERTLNAAGCDAADRHDLQLAVEELFSNVVRHGAELDPQAVIEISIALTPQHCRLELRDPAAAFNPLERADPDLDRSDDEAAEGGLGIYLVKQLCDTIDYRREGAVNVLTLTKRLSRPGQGSEL